MSKRKGLNSYSNRRNSRVGLIKEPIYLIVEGENTEPTYFEWLREKGYIDERFNLIVKPAGRKHGTSIKNIISYAEGYRQKSSDARIWVIVDKDENPPSQVQDLKDWIRLHCKNCDGAVVIPKFECFLLMHYADTRGLTVSSDFDEAMKKIQPDYLSHKKPNLKKLNLTSVYQAISRAKEKSNRSSDRDAYDVARLVETIIKSQ